MLSNPSKAWVWVCICKYDSRWVLYGTVAVNLYRNPHRLSSTYVHTPRKGDKTTNFFYCHCAWTLTLQVTQGVSCSELMNTLTCQWCALVTLSAGFVSVDGFSNKLLADPAPMLKTKVMQYGMLVSKNGKHPGGQHLNFSYYCTQQVYQCQVYVGHWESHSSCKVLKCLEKPQHCIEPL